MRLMQSSWHSISQIVPLGLKGRARSRAIRCINDRSTTFAQLISCRSGPRAAAIRRRHLHTSISACVQAVPSHVNQSSSLPCPVVAPTGSSTNPEIKLEETALDLHIHAPLYGLKHARFPWIWLRDACTAPESVDAATKQKLFRTSDVPADIRAASVTVMDGPGIRIVWNQPLLSQGHLSHGRQSTSEFSLEYLQRYATRKAWHAWHWESSMSPIPWDKTMLRPFRFHCPWPRTVAKLFLTTFLLKTIRDQHRSIAVSIRHIRSASGDADRLAAIDHLWHCFFHQSTHSVRLPPRLVQRF